jgi:methylmalonyl-CoA mutase N-terminal domain/subunit
MRSKRNLFNTDSIDKIRKKEEKWQRQVYPTEKQRQEVFKTLSGIPIEPIYTPLHLAEMDYLEDLGFPGEEPFVRGVHLTMYRGRNLDASATCRFWPSWRDE